MILTNYWLEKIIEKSFFKKKENIIIRFHVGDREIGKLSSDNGNFLSKVRFLLNKYFFSPSK